MNPLLPPEVIGTTAPVSSLSVRHRKQPAVSGVWRRYGRGSRMLSPSLLRSTQPKS